MTDPRSPTEIAKFPTQFEAEAVAAVVRDAGIQAVVFGDGGAFAGGLGAFGEWALMVPAADAEEARRVILQARSADSEASAFEECPGCTYSLSGLEKADKCPECGHDLMMAHQDAKLRGLVTARQIRTPTWAWKTLLGAMAVCIATGLLAIVLEHRDFHSRFEPWWVSLPIGVMFFALAAALIVRKRRRAVRATSKPFVDP